MRDKEAKEWTYYYIECMDLLGRGAGNDYCYYVYENGKWIEDVMHYIMDHLMGYSPDRIGDLDVMREIREISETEAMQIMTRQEKEGRRRHR